MGKLSCNDKMRMQKLREQGFGELSHHYFPVTFTKGEVEHC